MKWFQQNRALGTLLIVSGVCVLLGAALLYWRWSVWSEAKQNSTRPQQKGTVCRVSIRFQTMRTIGNCKATLRDTTPRSTNSKTS